MGVTIRWSDENRFDAEIDSGVRFTLDGGRDDGPSPMDALLGALAGCMAIDVVDILRKGRQDLEACTVRAEGDRRDEPPRRFTAIRLVFELEGRAISRQKAERAVRLSQERYCSVSATLDPDLDVSVEIEIGEVSPGAG